MSSLTARMLDLATQALICVSGEFGGDLFNFDLFALGLHGSMRMRHLGYGLDGIVVDLGDI